MDIFGSFALLLALLAAAYAFVAGITGILTRRTLLTKSARNAGMAAAEKRPWGNTITCSNPAPTRFLCASILRPPAANF